MRLALCQVDVTAEKSKNIATARDAIAAGAAGGAQVVSLPECWNSPYAVTAFPQYAEPVPAVRKRRAWMNCCLRASAERY